MKVRNGFVSNSSSSSFICDISGHTESGYDLCYDDAGFASCNNGHEFLQSYINEKYFKLKEYFDGCNDENPPQIEKIKEFVSDEFAEKYYKAFINYGNTDLNEFYYIPIEFCPICQMQHMAISDITKYALYKLNVTEEQLFNMYKEEFNSYESFKATMNGVKQ